MTMTPAGKSGLFGTLLSPLIFVLFWSSGPVATKVGLGYSEPFTFLALRFGVLALVLVPFFLRHRAVNLPLAGVLHAMVAGVFIQVVYLGTAYTAIKLGVSAGLSALITGLQPLVTSLIAIAFLGERLTRRKAAGILIGFLGLSLFVWGQLAVNEVRIELVLLHLVGLLGLAGGIVYQRRFGRNIGVGPNTAVQYAMAAAVFVPAALLLETGDVAWTVEFIAALGWMILGLSILATSLLLLLIKRHQAANVSSLFYLMPPTAAVLAYFVLGETLSLPAIAGLVVAVVGVGLIMAAPGDEAGIAPPRRQRETT